MRIIDAINERAVGQYPISIATSLALESAAGIHPDIPVDKVPILEYKQLWINVRTLFRNFLGSLEPTAANIIAADGVTYALAAEMDQIIQVVTSISEGKTRCVFYYSNYDLDKNKHKGFAEHKIGVLRVDTTDKQKSYTELHNATMKLLLPQCDFIKRFDTKIESANIVPPSMILTHYAYDLLSSNKFSKLVLLESHTGHIKDKGQWYTKYLNGKELSQIPFREGFLEIFGDNETYRPADIKLRREIVDIAKKYNWSQVSTHDKLRQGLDEIKNLYFKEVLRGIKI